MGQENAESAGSRQLSGIGGQMDFLEGAFRSKGGKGFICINSSRVTKEGERKSNILPAIPAGSTVSAPRTMIQYVATEYGVVSRRQVPAGGGPRPWLPLPTRTSRGGAAAVRPGSTLPETAAAEVIHLYKIV